MTPPDSQPTKSIGELFSQLSDTISALIKGEIELAKIKLKAMVSKIGTGVALLAIAAVFALYMLGVLLYAAIDGLATVMPHWAAALIVAGVLLVLAAILAGVGISLLKKGDHEKPEPQVGVKKSIDAIKDGLKK